MAENRLIDGSGSVIKQTERLKELVPRPRKTLEKKRDKTLGGSEEESHFREANPKIMINWAQLQFEQVVKMPEEYSILDLSDGKWDPVETDFTVGKYDELRPGMYNTKIFEGKRFLHVGIDIGGPVGTECMAFMDGEISHLGYNPEPGDYGNVVVLNIALVNRIYGHFMGIWTPSH